MRVVIFCHTLISDWNHGNAHFLRGVAGELIARGHDVAVYEPEDAWSVQNLLAEHGNAPLSEFHRAYPALRSIRYGAETLELKCALRGADLTLVHEWNEPALVQAIGEQHARSGDGVLLFHDTHHRSATDPEAMSRYDLRHYDGVLAFGDSVAEVYRRQGWSDRVWTWHEAADTRLFFPRQAQREGDLIWIGNWGDEERTAELRQFLIEPVRDLGLRARIHGVRYPQFAVDELQAAGIEYAGWTPNFRAPDLFARFALTVHVPRRPYAAALRGVPTIRVFEALACGIPLVSAPWDDSEHLFHPGKDFLLARTGEELREHIRHLLGEPAAAAEIAAHGLSTIRAKHTCAHRVDELVGIYEQLRVGAAATMGGHRV